MFEKYLISSANMNSTDNILKKHENGVKINLFVTPNSEKCKFPSGFNKWRKRLEINVCADAKKNLANLEVVKIISEFFNKPARNVCILSGSKTREKTVLIKDISENTAFKKLKESLNGL